MRNLLFLCTGNSARSILAEAIFNHLSDGTIRAHSAGSMPSGAPHPMALQILGKLDHELAGLRSKSWDEFAAPGAPKMDFIITVCDNAAGEVCPVWPGQPVTAHWGLPDPAAATGSEAECHFAFAETYRMLTNRISAFLALPLDRLDAMARKRAMDEIGRFAGATAGPAA